jgi:flagellin
MVINTNIAAESSASLLSASSANLAKSLQRLSSGSKIISPEDDAAGLGVSMKFDAQSSRISAASNNVSNAVSYTQTQDGFLQQVGKALDRMSELAVSAQDVTKTTTDLSLYNAEYGQLASYITDTAKKDFNSVSLFNNVDKMVTVDSDANTFKMGAIALVGGASTAYTDATAQAGLAGIGTTLGAIDALGLVKTAITQLASDRSTIGASLARLNYTHDQLSVQKTNIDAANGQLKDVDVATESTNYAKLNILVQSGTAMLAQANTMPQSVLKLLG